MADNAVRIEGLAPLRRALDPPERKEITAFLKGGATVVAVRGGATSPRGTLPIPASRKPRKRLADTIAPGTAGNSAFVRSRALYGPKIERSTGFLSKALEDTADEVMEIIGNGIDAWSARQGWR